MLEKTEIKIGIVSCDQWIGKIKEDLWLTEHLQLRGYTAELISWENKDINFSDYDALILRSVWGYQKQINEFNNWLDLLDKNNIKLINDSSIIRTNIDKYQQFEILKKNNIPVIPTLFIKNQEEFREFLKNPFTTSDVIVIKPITSGSGENTHVVSSVNDYEMKNQIPVGEIKSYYQEIVKTRGIMVQPFLNEIFAGEHAIIYIDGENTHNILRFPTIFHDNKKKEYLPAVPASLLQLAEKVSKLSEFNNYLYMRIDLIMHQNEPLIMEVELAEPDLLIKEIPDPQREQVLEKFVDGVERRI